MILMSRPPKYYKELAKKRKEFEREQANKLASERAHRRAGGPEDHKLTSRGASKQAAIKHPRRTRATSAECGPNHSLRGKVFRGGLQADRGASYF